MALNREVEIVLAVNSMAAKQALESIEGYATRATTAIVQNKIKDIGTTTVTQTMAMMDRISRESNTHLANNMREQATKASQSISAALRDVSALSAAGDEEGAVLRLREMSKQMEAYKKLTEDEDIQKALGVGIKDAFSMANLRDAASNLSDVFERALNGVDPNDLGGFVKSLGGAASKGLARLGEQQKAKQVALTAAGDVAGAKAAGSMAAALTGAAAAIAAVAAVFALFVAFLKAADDYQAKLNKTILEGASVADIMGVAYETGGRNLLTLTETMSAARRAAVDTAVQFKMTTDETARVLSELNSAGITYKRIIDGARTASEAQDNFAAAISQTITYSSMLGVSVSELAQYQNTLMKDVNLSLDRTFDVFGAISEASKASGMATKTFFTAISQATSGMALYNVRIDQAIGLVAAFAKSVGETDAGKVLGELTGKKSVDERLRMAATAVESVGIEEVRNLYRDSALASADEFQRSFAGQADAIAKVFADAGQEELGKGLMSTDAKKRAQAVQSLADLPDAIREQLMAAMENIQGGAASRMFGTTAIASKGIKGDLDTLAGSMNQLDLAAKLELMDMQLKLMEREGKKPEEALRSATGQKFLEAFGLTEDQIVPLLRGQAYREAVNRVRSPGEASPGDIETLKGAGFTVAGDKVFDKFGREVESIGDVFRGLSASMESAQTAEDRRVANERQQMQGTITDALNAWVQGSLFENALADAGLLGQILKFISDGEYDPERIARERETKTAALAAATERKERADAALQAGPNMTPLLPGEEAGPGLMELEAEARAADIGRAGAKAGLGITASGQNANAVLAELAMGGESGQAAMAQIQPLVTAYEEANKKAALAILNPEYATEYPLAHIEYLQAKAQLEKAISEITGRPLEVFGQMPGDTTFKPATKVNDAFISKDGAMYHGPSADNILMFKDGGPLDPRTGGGGGGNVVININGGDQAMVYRTVARAMRAAEGR